MRLECDKYQGGQFPNLERHLSLLLSFFPVWHFVLSHFSPETVSVYRPLLFFSPFFYSIPSSILFFCQPLSSGHFLSDLHFRSSHLLPSSPSLLLLLISFHPHTLVFWLLLFWKGDTLLLCLMIFIRADCRIIGQVVDHSTSGQLWNTPFRW